MTQAQLVKSLAAILGSSQRDTGLFLDGLAIAVAEALAAGEAVEIPGVVLLSVRPVPARSGKVKLNTLTGLMITVQPKPANRKVRARPAGALRKAVKLTAPVLEPTPVAL